VVGRGRRRGAGELEREVLAALWAGSGPRTPAQVRQVLGEGLAYNTVQTILTRLCEKGLVSRRRVGRAFGYEPVVAAEDLLADRMGALLVRGDDRAAVLQRFVASLSVEDERVLRALLDHDLDRKPGPD
jgi:predicted transcriptional regulator